MENSNILTVAWTGIVNTVPPKTYISVRPQRHSYAMIREHGEFIINLTTEALIRAADYCGMYTGAKVDKFAACGLHREAAEGFACPMIAESPLSLCCRVTDVIPMGSHDMFLADIVSVQVDESLLDKAGKLHLDGAHLAAFAHGDYFALGKKLGTFGFSAAKPKRKQPAGSIPPRQEKTHTEDPQTEQPQAEQPQAEQMQAEQLQTEQPRTERTHAKKTHAEKTAESVPETKKRSADAFRRNRPGSAAHMSGRGKAPACKPRGGKKRS